MVMTHGNFQGPEICTGFYHDEPGPTAHEQALEWFSPGLPHHPLVNLPKSIKKLWNIAIFNGFNETFYGHFCICSPPESFPELYNPFQKSQSPGALAQLFPPFAAKLLEFTELRSSLEWSCVAGDCLVMARQLEAPGMGDTGGRRNLTPPVKR